MVQELKRVNDIDSLMNYFVDNLGWPIDSDDYYDIEDITYDFEANDLGLKEEAFAKIISLKQLRPLVDGQRWGIFFVNFESNRFEISALRKILSGLVPSRRNADHAVWDKKDLLFLCTWGECNKTTIGVAYFEDTKKGLPQIKMISCEPAAEDFTQINVFEQRLSKLAWPSNPNDFDAWQQAWASAFTTKYRQPIQDAHTLTVRLAEEAQNIRDRILSTLEIETSNGYVHLLFQKFRNTLVHDMTEQEFADMYAQTVVYGLFSARCMDESQDDFDAAEAVDCIPNTNPFLRGLLQECLGSRNAKSKLLFDELEVDNIVALLLNTKTDAIITDFNRQTGGGREDPVIHFYEEFLSEYDKTQRVQRGVYYTPQSVVNFIVRAVDDILKKDFGFEDGLASTSTKKIKYLRESKKKMDGYHHTIVEDEKEVPAIQILDPATGTGTFLRQAILQIYDNFCNARKGASKDLIKKEWNEYVPKHLLLRLNGFELMMAPYAVAHMKLAMVLKDTGYLFDADERLQVFLTNTLEKPGNSENQLNLFDDPLAFESVSANAVKKNNGINIVLGNPPYSGESANKGDWIMSLMEDYKKEPGGKIKLQEQNSKWINDDYVKFIRYAQTFIAKSSEGILAYINPHGFIDNPTFRGMRWFLMQSFSKIYILDLHGNSKKKEECPDGSKDENVFDIQQGVCIWIGVKTKRAGLKSARIFHADLYGVRTHKYDFLNKNSLNSIHWEEITPNTDNYYFMPQSQDLTQEWYTFFKIEELFPINGVGICSKRDTIAYHDTKSGIKKVVHDFMTLSEQELKIKYNVTSESRDQKVSYAMENVRTYGDQEQYYKTCLYRPFDQKWTYYTDKVRGFLAYPVYKVLKHMLHDNMGLIVSRQGQASDLGEWNVVFATDTIVDLNVFRRGGGCLFPLYIYDNEFGKIRRHPNLNSSIVNKIASSLGLNYSPDSDKDEGTLFPKDIFFYIYAILQSKNYRTKYKEFLNLDFPRIPYPVDADVFWRLVSLGSELYSVHTQKILITDDNVVFDSGTNLVEKITYKNGTLYINKSQKVAPVSEETWSQTIGGYEVLAKWLKDRKGTLLTDTDKEHFKSIIGALEKTQQIMAEIDSI